MRDTGGALGHAGVAGRVRRVDSRSDDRLEGSGETIGRLDTLKEATKVYTNHISKVAQAAEARGLREAYVETAKWKFGADAAERLADVLSGVTDRSRLERLGRLLAECETGDELIAKAGSD